MKNWINKMKIRIHNADVRSVKIKDIRVFFLMIILGIIFHIGYSYYLIDGDSMESTFKEGEKLLVNKITYNFSTPDKGDVDFISFFIQYNGGTNTDLKSYKVYVSKNGGFGFGTVGI